VDKRIEKGEKKEVAIVNVLKDYIKDSKKVLFEGDGYSESWVKEAKKRGLSNVTSCVEALDAFLDKNTVAVFEKFQIMSHREIEARHEILLENYIKKIQIESRMMGELVVNHVIPTAISYQNKLVEYVKNLRDIGIEDELAESTKVTIKKIAEHVNSIQKLTKEMIDARKAANNTADIRKRAEMYNKKVKSFFDEIRYGVDKLELIVSDEVWPIAKYREILFAR
jgi:glutamine synthetase